jgi:hypothetical protein
MVSISKIRHKDVFNMKKALTIVLALLTIASLPFGLSACAGKYDKELDGVWQVTSYVTADGTDASIENDLFLVFYGNGYGETKNREQSHNSFQYTARKGQMTRTIHYGRGEPEQVEETYRIEADGTLVIVSPETRNAPAATMKLKKVETY